MHDQGRDREGRDRGVPDGSPPRGGSAPRETASASDLRADGGNHAATHAHEGGHEHHEGDVEDPGIGLLTISSSRTLEDDEAGDSLERIADEAGLTVEARTLVPDEVGAIRGAVETMLDDEDVDVVVTTGGTGLTPDDVTLQAVEPLFTRRIPGFGELFRYLSYEDVGAMALASRAGAGLADDVPVFCVPGSEAAATLALEELIIPTAGHLAGLARRHER